MTGSPCILCGFPRPGDHEPWCAHFMRGPDAGGDPFEWETLFEVEACAICSAPAGEACLPACWTND